VILDKWDLNNRDNAQAVAIEYLTSLADELEKFRIATPTDPFDEEVVRNIEGFLP
jgi:hypothetical protein